MKKVDPIKKIKLVYSGELMLFFALFLLLGVFFLTGIIKVREWKRYVFSIVTLIGGIWLLIDFFWTMFSPKRKAKNSLIDKILVFPVGIALIVFDIIAIVYRFSEDLPYRYVIGIDLCYLSAVYLFEAIYHYFKPVPLLLNAIEEEKKSSEEPPQESVEKKKEE